MALGDLGAGPQRLHVVVVGVDLDARRRPPLEVVSTWPFFGVAEAAVARHGRFRVSVVQASWYEENHCIHGIPCHFVRERRPLLRLPGGRVVRRLPHRLCARVAELRPGIVHFGGLGFSRDLWLLRRLLPDVALVVQAHSAARPRGWRRLYFRLGSRWANAAIFCTDAQAEEFKREGLIPRGLPTFDVLESSTAFTPGDANEERALGRLEGDPSLLWLGNLDANKDPLMVLDAVAEASSELPGIRLHMCFRECQLLERVRARLAADGALARRVSLRGEISHRDVEAHLRAADFLVQGSHHEGSGFAVIEALACGTTPLVTDIPSFRRITGDGRYGALVPVGDARGLARAIVDWSRRDRRELRHLARAHFDQALSFDAVGEQLRDVYERIVSLAPASRYAPASQ